MTLGPKSSWTCPSDGAPDSVAADNGWTISRTRIEAKIGAPNFHRYTVPWREGGVQPTDLDPVRKEVVLRL